MDKSHDAPRLPMQQLIVLCICRFAEPIALSSVNPYLPEMIESFHVPKDQVAKWAGISAAAFSLSQAMTGIAWGRASDRFGRKPAVLCGMVCIMTTTLLFGFSKSLKWVIVTRSLAGIISFLWSLVAEDRLIACDFLFLGASNGNVGTMRTIVAELVPEKSLQPLAFSIMPLTWNLGSIVGPVIGGILANPAARYPAQFGNNKFFRSFPFSLPNIVSSTFFLVGLLAGGLLLRETLASKKYRRDYGLALGQLLLRPFRRRQRIKWQHDESTSSLLRHSRGSSASTIGEDTLHRRLNQADSLAPPTYREVLSYQSNMNLLAYTLLALHSIAYDQLLPILMHYPVEPDRHMNMGLKFTSGFGIDSDRIGFIFMLYGTVGVFIQFLIFPPLARRIGVLKCLKIVSILYPIAYIMTPFTALCPTALTQQVAIFGVMLIKCWAVIFAFPCMTILLTNSAKSVRVLGTLNGIAVSLSALGRAIGPAVGGWSFTLGLKIGYGILPWWTLAAFAVIAAVPVWWLVEQDFGDSEQSNDQDDEHDRITLAEEYDDEPEGVSPFSRMGDKPITGAQDDDLNNNDGSHSDHRGLSKTSSWSNGVAGPRCP